MQETSGASGLATAGMAGATDPEMDALRQELTKWQERVPKLAAALRERTGEVETLRKELAQLAAAGSSTGSSPEKGSGIEARDALIGELEAKVKALGGKYQDAEGQLHARDLEIGQLRQEAAEWREKWQSATASLDAQADSVDHKDRELSRLKQEVDELLARHESGQARIKDQDLELTSLRERARSLESRNENLFETTELANRQIETLGENLDHLRQELAASKEALATHEKAAGGALKDIEDLKGQVASRDQDIAFLHKHVEEKQADIDRLNERINALEPLEAANTEARETNDRLTRQIEDLNGEIGSLTGRLAELDAARKAVASSEDRIREVQDALDASQAETAARDEQIAAREADIDAQKEEVRRLEDCVANAEEATIRFEVERRQLSEQLNELKKRNQHLEAQLSERSDLVVGLEEEKSAISSRTTSLEAENKRLSESLEKAQQAAAGNADHIAQVDARMERQKQHMDSLEAELAEVQQALAEARKAHQRELAEKAAELTALREQVEDESVAELKQALSELESSLDEARQARAAAETVAGDARAASDKAADANRALESRCAEETSARKAQSEKVAELERQLKKQSQATALAEEATARARAELDAARSEAADSIPDDVATENAALQAEVIKLEGMVRERTEQLNKLRWQQDMIEKQSGGEGSENKMLVVLNQQLQSARDDNQRLKDRIRDLEAAAAAGRESAIDGGAGETTDDLSRIKGIGPKLVKQLRKLGVTRFDQIAMLSEADLDDEAHPLHGMKGRILKDNWIGQSAKFGGEI